MGRGRLKELGKKINTIQIDFDRLESMRSEKARSPSSDGILGRLVKNFQSILQAHEKDFNLIPEAPSAGIRHDTPSLIDRLRKVSQYAKACDELLRAARRCDVFSHIAIEPVDFQRTGPRLFADGPADIARLISVCCPESTMSRFEVQRNLPVSAVRKAVTERLASKSKMHAEIQLALHYEESPAALCPRVICSSKRACYLCQVFFNAYGQYHIPSTHGGLYDTWNWPVPSHPSEIRYSDQTRVKLESVLLLFSQVVDRKLLECLNLESPMRRFDRLESRVDIRAVMTPSVLSYDSAIANGVGPRITRSSHSPVETLTQLMSIPRETSLGPQENGSAVTGLTSPPVGDVIIDSVANESRQATQPSPASNSSLQSVSTVREMVATPRQAELLYLQPGDVRSPMVGLNSLLRINTPGLHVDVEHKTHHTESLSTGQPLLIEVQYLSSLPDENGNEQAYLIDLDVCDWVEQSPPDGVLFRSGGLLLKRKSILLRLRIKEANLDSNNVSSG